MEIFAYLFSCVVGIILGSIFAILYFQMDNLWKRLILLVFSPSVTAGSLFLSRNLFLENKGGYSLYGLIMLLSIIIAFLVVLRLFLKSLKDENPLLEIKKRDIFLGYKEYIKQYYEHRKSIIDKQLMNYDDKIIELKNLEDKNAQALDYISKLKEEYNECIKEKDVYLKLPYNKMIPIGNKSLKKWESFIRKTTIFMMQFHDITTNYINEFTQKKNTRKKDLLIAYFQEFCEKVIEIFLTESSARVHIRYLSKKDKQYKKLSTSVNEENIKYDLSPIELSNNMINESGRIKKSLIKSLNPEFHQKTDSNRNWEDYITFTLPKFIKNDIPIISIGISIKNREEYIDFLYFLNYIKFEEIIQDEISRFNHYINISQVIENM